MASKEIVEELIIQLSDGGMLFIPVGSTRDPRSQKARVFPAGEVRDLGAIGYHSNDFITPGIFVEVNDEKVTILEDEIIILEGITVEGSKTLHADGLRLWAERERDIPAPHCGGNPELEAGMVFDRPGLIEGTYGNNRCLVVETENLGYLDKCSLQFRLTCGQACTKEAMAVAS